MKTFATVNDLPENDLLRASAGNPALDFNADLRLLFRERRGNWEWLADHSTILISGDSSNADSLLFSSSDATPGEDDQRALDLSWKIDSGGRHRAYHRLDRLAVRYRADSWAITLGRDAVSWGSGKVFNPLDLFSPFAPTTVDRDYKPGDDLLLLEKLLADGGELQFLAIARRDRDGDRSGAAGSAAAKWRGYFGDRELEVTLGSHYQDSIAAVSLRTPWRGALIQTDIVATRLEEEHDWVVSSVINMDYSFAVADKTAYVFAEYYHNGFGRSGGVLELDRLPVALLSRLERGEVFGVAKNYLAFGGNYQWHPLLSQSVTVLWNLHDHSTLWQSGISLDGGDSQRFEAGLTLTQGGMGDEYGPVPITLDKTTGGGSRLYFRWVYHW